MVFVTLGLDGLISIILPLPSVCGIISSSNLTPIHGVLVADPILLRRVPSANRLRTLLGCHVRDLTLVLAPDDPVEDPAPEVNELTSDPGPLAKPIS